jgi:hypothetical protein
MIAYCPLEELDPPIRPKQPVVEYKTEEVKPRIGHEETEMNYVIMAFIVGVMLLAVSDSIRA